MKDFLACKQTKIKASLLTIIITIILFSQLALSGGIASAQDVPDESVDTFADLVAAIGRAPANGTPYIIEITDDITFTNVITINNSKNVIIESDSHGPWMLIRNSGSASNLTSSRHFLVDGTSADPSNTGTLTLANIVVDGSGTHGGINVGHNTSTIVGGVLYLNEGAVIQNCSNTNAANGGGLTVYNGGTAIVNGGIITGNKKIMTNGGGGVYVYGNSTFTMNSGEISGNTSTTGANTTSNFPGGGLSTYGGSIITINGGQINNNESTQHGGGLNIGSSTLIITGGEISGNKTLTASSNCYGGGIYATNTAALSISNATITNNEAKSYGGGIYATCDFTISDSTISGNKAGNYGGGIYTSNELTVSDCIISGNTGNALYGGGIYGTNTSSINIKGSTIGGDMAADANTAVNGGGIYTSGILAVSDNSVISGNKATGNGGGIYGNSLGSFVTVSNSTIGGDTEACANTAVNGGGIYTTGSVTVSDNSVVLGNKATTNGGAIYGNTVSATITIINSTIGGDTAAKSNTAVNGGGIYSSGAITVSGNSVICGNKATTNGGGIFGNGAGSSINIVNSTIGGDTAAKSNTAVNGGGIYSSGAITVSGNSVICGNKATSNGGGIYIPATGMLEVTGQSRLTGNTSVSGGAIYTASTNFSNIVTAANTIFSGNRASAAYKPPTNAETLYPDIKFAETSITVHPLSNYDINYSGLLLTFSLTYDANEGTGSPYTVIDINPGDAVEVLSLDDTGISHNNSYTFAGWNTVADGTGTVYQPGDDIIVLDDTILYAQWIIINSPPDPSDPSEPAEPKPPKTGDSNSMVFSISLICISSCAIVLICRLTGKKKRHN